MGLNTKSNYNISGLDMQDVEHHSSTVNRINFEVEAIGWDDNNRVMCDDHELANEKVFLENIYGYHTDSVGAQKRMTPSAGAIYPLELLLLKYLKGRWRLFQYVYKTHEFYDVKDADINALITKFSVSTDKSYILFYLISWRSVQKYGVRGFRYAYLDAAFILHNVLLISASLNNQPEVYVYFPSSVWDDLLPGNFDKSLLLTIELSHILATSVRNKDGLRNQRQLKAKHSSIIYPDLYHANLLRINKMFLCVSKSNVGNFPHQVQWKEENSTAEISAYLNNRSSAKSFTPDPVLLETYKAIQSDLSQFTAQLNWLSKGLSFEVVFLPSKIISCTPAIEFLLQNFSKPIPNIDNLQLRIAAACQNQSIMLNSAFIMVVIVNVNEKFKEVTGYLDYVRSILLSGMFCAKAYQSSLKNGLGTTTIGGFSEKMMKQLLGLDDYLPIVVQAFGVADNSREKYDHAKLISL